jgi:hypothetical protein
MDTTKTLSGDSDLLGQEIGINAGRGVPSVGADRKDRKIVGRRRGH